MADIVVDTTEMARSLDKVSARVLLTQTAVVQMEQELCGIEKEAAKEISANVNKGFFLLQRAQISQKKIMVASTVESALLSLKQSAHALVMVREQMGRDYERITSRYTRLFEKLNDALKTRIYAVDQPAGRIADTECRSLTRRATGIGAPVVVVQQEILQSQLQLMIARFKRDCLGFIDRVKTLIMHGIVFQRTFDGALHDAEVEREKMLYLPVVLISGDDIHVPDSVASDIVIGEEAMQKSFAPRIKSVWFEKENQCRWRAASPEEKESVRRALQKKFSGIGAVDENIRRTMLELFDKSEWTVPEEIR